MEITREFKMRNILEMEDIDQRGHSIRNFQLLYLCTTNIYIFIYLIFYFIIWK